MLLKILRWISVFPGAILAGIAATFILHFLLYLLLSKFYSTYPEFPERALTPFAVSITFVIVGAAIAPYYKIETALTLLFIWVTFAIFLATIHFTERRWFGKETSFEADGLSMAFGIIGSFLGLLFVKNGLRENTISISKHEDHEVWKKTLKINRTQDISDIVFLSLFLLCVFNDLSRSIFFGFYLAFILFVSWWTVKEKLYKTKIQLLDFIKGLFMVVCLVVGLIYPTAGIYVSVVCSSLCAVPFIVRTIREVRYSNIVNNTA